MAVYWTIQARQHLRRVLAEALHREHAAEPPPCVGVLEQTRRQVDAVLGQAFPGSVIFVKDQVIGYRPKGDLFILLIEVFADDPEGQSGPYVVKIGPERVLKKEAKGWECCRPVGQGHDVVLLSLRSRGPFAVPERGDAGKSVEWTCLIYGDAQQVLGVNTTTTFEEAALQCVRHGTPTLDSILAVVNELYERVGHLLYFQAFVDDPADQVGQPGGPRNLILDGTHFDEILRLWQTDPACRAVRLAVDAALGTPSGKYLDPIDYFRYIQTFVTHASTDDGAPASKLPRRAPLPTVPGLTIPIPRAVNLIPRTLRGCAHGDLHGRNLLVGIVHDKAMWPTLFDYEDMAPGNPIGWDFVKLETELKIRAYHHIFAGSLATNYVEAIRSFEAETHEQTQTAHDNHRWPAPTSTDTPVERLRAILLMIRRQASQHLGINQTRPNDWLEESHFLLAAYGVGASRFGNLTPRERTGALVSAGVAAARLSWPREARKSFGP